MATNTLNTRIRLKYDTLVNWNASSLGENPFIPLMGEVCIAVIPKSTSNDYTVGNPNESGLSPYAIGIKVGDGTNPFADLPWIQAIAGDVYAWAKSATPGTSINVQYNNNTTTLQNAINSITEAIGGIVSSNISSDALTAALDQLAQQMQGNGTATPLFTSNEYTEVEEGQTPERLYPTKIVRSIVRNGLNITVDGDYLTAADIPNLTISKITDLVFNSSNAAYNATTNKAATMADIQALSATLTKALKFIGVVTSPAITDGSTTSTGLTINGSEYTATLAAGDVILYNNGTAINQEFVWTGTMWELLGDEGSYAIKGSITKSDLAAALQEEITGKVDSVAGSRLITSEEATKLTGIETGAEVNTIETVKVNGTALTPDANKAVDVIVPITIIKKTDGTQNGTTTVTPTDHAITLDDIAFDGDVSHLKQTSGTILVFNCGSASTVIG